MPTKVAIFADVHGNGVALEAVLEDMTRSGADRVVCLGDVSGTGPRPRETLERVRALDCPVVTGNVDAWMLAPHRAAEPGTVAAKIEDADLWCREQLDEAHLRFISSFAPTVSLEVGGRRLMCAHGSPRDFDEGIRPTTPDATIEEMLHGHSASVVAVAHTHEVMVRRLGDRLLVNPGSVGMPVERLPDGTPRHPPWGEYAVLVVDEESVEVRLRQVPLDREEVASDLRGSALPHRELFLEGWRR